MNYKKILNVVGVAAVAVVLSVGCTNECTDSDNYNSPMVGTTKGCEADNNKPDGGGGGSGLAGDWLMEERNNVKAFYSFKSSNDLVLTGFEKFGDFWIESGFEIGKYSIKDDSVCVIVEDRESCIQYSVSGNNLSMVGESCHYYYDNENNEEVEECYPDTMTFVRSNVATVRNSLGSNLKTQNPALTRTEWERESSNPDCEWCGNDRIEFWSDFYDSRHVYISEDANGAAWYTEGSRLTLVGLECAERETVKEDDDEWERCVSYSVSQTVTLDYELANGTLRLKADGKDWDTWTPYSWDDDGGMYKSKAKAKSPKSKRSVNTFFKISKK